MEATTKANAPEAFFNLVRNPLKLRMFLLRSLPSAFFSDLRVVSASEAACTVSVPYKWFTKNPFRSTYFACHSMAAELSTGVLAMAHIWRRKPAVSMLVTHMEAQFHKKASGLTSFTCAEGNIIKHAVETAVSTGQGQTVKVHSVGRNNKGELIAEFWFEWSFKSKA